MPERFALHDLDVHFRTFRRAYPKNKNVAAKVRQTLQRLRDRGILRFLSKGIYRRLAPRPAPTIDIDFTGFEHFKSESQRARALEVWARLNLWCHNCGNPNLVTLPPGTPVADLRSPVCSMEYQIKSTQGRFGGSILGAAYGPLEKRCKDGVMPDYLLIEYDLGRRQVVRVNLIRGIDLTMDRIVKRTPLKETARRAGWIGCNIRIDGLDEITIVSPAFLPRT